MTAVVFLGILFLISVQPVMMVGILILITLMYSFWIYKIMASYWFSYALIMVMLSGVLVVFTYLVSLMPNEMFEMFNLILIIVFGMSLMGGFYLFYQLDFSFTSLALWNSYVGIFNLFLVSFLLSVMIMVVWISGLEQGAVRIMWSDAWLKG